MLHVPSFRDVGRSRNSSCFLSSLTNLEVQYLILVRCRIVVHPWNTISPSPFRPLFFVCGPLLRLSQVRQAQGGGWLSVGDDSDPDTSRSFHEKLLNIVY